MALGLLASAVMPGVMSGISSLLGGTAKDAILGNGFNKSNFLGGLVDIGSNLLGGLGNLFSFNSQRKAQEEQQAFIKEQNMLQRTFESQEAQKAYNRQVDFFNLQNKYNSPSNQRKLMEDAGFNPYSMYGDVAGGSVSTGSSSAPQAHSPSIGFPSVMQIPDLLMATSQAKLNNSQARNLDKNTEGQELNNYYNQLKITLFEKYGEGEKIMDLDAKQASISLTHAQAAEIASRTALNNYDLENMRPAERDKLIAETVVANSQAALNQIRIAQTEQEMEIAIQQYLLSVQVATSQIASNYASANASNSQAALLGVQTQQAQFSFDKESSIWAATKDTVISAITAEMENSEYQNRVNGGKRFDNDSFFGRLANKAVFLFDSSLARLSRIFGATAVIPTGGSARPSNYSPVYINAKN